MNNNIGNNNNRLLQLFKEQTENRTSLRELKRLHHRLTSTSDKHVEQGIDSDGAHLIQVLSDGDCGVGGCER